MENTVQKIPFLRPTFMLAFGILIAAVLHAQIYYLLAFSALLFFAALFIHQKFTYGLSTVFGICIHLIFILIGALTFEIYNQKPVFIRDGVFVATILEQPQEKKNSYKSVVQLFCGKSENQTIETKEKLLVYFDKTDEVQQLSAGNNIIFSAVPQTIKNYGNPHEFDYKKYLERRHIYRQIYLNSEQWRIGGFSTKSSLIIKAEQFREKLLKIYREQQFGKNELEILSALTLGYKRELDPDTKRIFSNSGAMHVLAVSGLHVGIVFWIIVVLFGFLRKRKIGKVLFIVLSIVLLWAYAFITGLSPSVMRAATMFSIFVVADNVNRKSNSYNVLAASALFLLLVNPNNLFEVGFQLSYAAVFGILFLHPKISKILRVKNKVLQFFWSLICISIAAQIATFPISSFYFNQFPTYFLITNLLVIPAAMLLIPLGISLLIFSKITFVSVLISKLIQLIITFSYQFLAHIEQLPFSVQKFSIHPIQLFLIVAILLSLFLYLNTKSLNFIKTILLFVLFLSMSVLFQNIKQNNSREIIVYNTENTTIQLINGKANYVLSELTLSDSLQILSAIEKTSLNKHLSDPVFISPYENISNQHLILKNGFLFFAGKSILIENNLSFANKIIAPDWIINPKQMSSLDGFKSDKTILITNKSFKQNTKSLPNSIYEIAIHGAFQEIW